MGYYTAYNMSVIHIKDEDEFKKLESILEEYGIINYSLAHGYFKYRVSRDGSESVGCADFDCCDCVKWYDYNEHITEISKKFPDMVFYLHGEGEETGDLWDAYYKNGDWEHCRAEVVYPEPETIKWEVYY